MRTTRNQTEFTKKRISDAMKRKHQQRTDFEKKQTAAKQSASMQAYWRTIPKIEENVDFSISDYQEELQALGITKLEEQESILRFLFELANIACEHLYKKSNV